MVDVGKFQQTLYDINISNQIIIIYWYQGNEIYYVYLLTLSRNFCMRSLMWSMIEDFFEGFEFIKSLRSTGTFSWRIINFLP